MTDQGGDGADARARRGRQEPVDEYNSELPPQTGPTLAAALPESFGVTIDLSTPRDTESDDDVARGEITLQPVRAADVSTHSIPVTTGPTRGLHRGQGPAAGSADGAGAGAQKPASSPSATSATAGTTKAVASKGASAKAPPRPAGPETASMLTPERLLESSRKTRPAPEGGWNRVVYNATGHLVNLGDSRAVRARKNLDERIQRPFGGGTRFVPVLTRKGGVGKTTVTALLGMALADAREDRVVAIDANPDRGTLSERITKQTGATVRDVVGKAPSIGGYTDFSALVSRDETRLDILASDTDPLLSEAFEADDYNVVADLSARFYSIVLTDCGTGIVHSVMRATLQRADSIVIVSGGSVDEARLASETLTWLEANGYADLVKNSVVALNTATQATNLVKLEEIDRHFASRVREVVRIPYDPVLAAGSVIHWKDLKPLTRHSARVLAALVVEGLPGDGGH
ncbi:MinD/ParA family protein [Rathayibacter sp. YIM 133350]|uniref:MinD/ParA family ATP-binding protein n=1 Tax=Rathayibacter sp. YIM 133350 TaxID=3131992 RepID=UPI00307E43F6